MGLDRPERAFGLPRDLLEREFAEEPEDHDFAIWLRQSGDRGPKGRRTLRPKGMRRRVGRRASPKRGRRDGVATRVVRRGLEPCDRPSLTDPSQRDANGDAGQPRTKRSVVAPAGERTIGSHECLLGGILGLVQVTEDAVAGPDDGRRLSLDEVAVRVAVTTEDCIDDGTLGALTGRVRGGS
jgi:hypothetical protein